MTSETECRPVYYEVDQVKYDAALVVLKEALFPKVVFIEDMDIMRKKANTESAENTNAAYQLFCDLINN